MGDLQATWAEHDRRLREVLERLPEAVTGEVRDEVEYLLTHREYGAALHGLLSYLRDAGITVDPSTREFLEDLVAAMVEE